MNTFKGMVKVINGLSAKSLLEELVSEFDEVVSFNQQMFGVYFFCYFKDF